MIVKSTWFNIGYCECETTCERWGINEDGSGGYFCPYVPENIESGANKCKKLSSVLGKNIKPTIIKTVLENNQ